jgi:bacterioferritin-associated ferredoxin
VRHGRGLHPSLRFSSGCPTSIRIVVLLCVFLCAASLNTYALTSSVVGNLFCKFARTHGTTSESVGQIARSNRCDVCNAVFDSKQKLALHRFKEHDRARSVRQYAVGSQCIACLHHLFSRDRLVCHLAEKSARCRQLWYMQCPPLSSREHDDNINSIRLETADLAKHGWSRDKATTHIVRAAGPLLRIADLAGIDHRIGLRGPIIQQS